MLYCVFLLLFTRYLLLLTCDLSMSVSVLFCLSCWSLCLSLFSVVMFDYFKIIIMGGQLEELPLASLAARCHVYLLSWLYCILFIAR